MITFFRWLEVCLDAEPLLYKTTGSVHFGKNIQLIIGLLTLAAIFGRPFFVNFWMNLGTLDNLRIRCVHMLGTSDVSGILP